MLRPYTAADHEAVIALHVAALSTARVLAPDPRLDRDLLAIEECYRSPGAFLVGTIGSRVVAMAGLRPAGPRTAEIRRVRVAPDVQGRGIGGRILRELEAIAVGRGFDECRLETTAEQAAARALFTRAGYRVTERRRLAGFESLTMRRPLPR